MPLTYCREATKAAGLTAIAPLHMSYLAAITRTSMSHDYKRAILPPEFLILSLMQSISLSISEITFFFTQYFVALLTHRSS